MAITLRYLMRQPPPKGNRQMQDDTITNPGFTRKERLIITLVVGAIATLAGQLIIDWPPFMFVCYWGPVLFTVKIMVGAFLLTHIKKTPFQLAIQEFGHLGISETLIGEVIVENREKATALGDLADTLEPSSVTVMAGDIKSEVMAIIRGFADDPTDVQRSRSVLNRGVDQALKIVENYATISKRLASMDINEFKKLHDQTHDGLATIRDALMEQHRRNLDNNTTALEVDLMISDRLLGK